MESFPSDFGRPELTIGDKIRGIQWGLVLLIAAISGIGFAMLYSAANGNLQPWASRQMTRFAIALVPMIAAGLIGLAIDEHARADDGYSLRRSGLGNCGNDEREGNNQTEQRAHVHLFGVGWA